MHTKNMDSFMKASKHIDQSRLKVRGTEHEMKHYTQHTTCKHSVLPHALKEALLCIRKQCHTIDAYISCRNQKYVSAMHNF